MIDWLIQDTLQLPMMPKNSADSDMIQRVHEDTVRSSEPSSIDTVGASSLEYELTCERGSNSENKINHLALPRDDVTDHPPEYIVTKLAKAMRIVTWSSCSHHHYF